jgi:hypothetical protein
MAQVYFHCSDAQRVMVDRRGADVVDLTEAREHAARLIRSLISAPTLEDWRNWVLHISDDLGCEILAVPFASAIGRPH